MQLLSLRESSDHAALSSEALTRRTDEILLKRWLDFTDIMEKSCHSAPLASSESRGELLCQQSYILKMLFKLLPIGPVQV